MTTIVGIQTKYYAVLAADSQVTEDNLRTISLTTPKIISIGRYLLGVSGDSRSSDILSYNWKPPIYKNEDPVQFMGKRIIPSIISSFNEHSYEWRTLEKDAGFDYLIAFGGNIFHIACDMSFLQSQYGYYAIGSGGQFALGYLYSLVRTDMSLTRAEKSVRIAVEIASELDVNSCLPIQVVIQETL